MKIAVDAGCLGVLDERLKVGVYTVVKNMLLELSKLDTKNQYYLYSFYPIEKNLLQQLGPNFQNIVMPSLGWLSIILPIGLFLDRVDIFIAANQAMPLALSFSRYKTLGLFYDIAFEKYPKLYSYAASVARHKTNSRNLAKKSDMLIAISRSTKNDLEKQYYINPGKIEVAYPGVDSLNKQDSGQARMTHTSKKNSSRIFSNNKHIPYFLFVGAFKKSKNIPMLLQAFSQFLKTSPKPYDLLLVGGDKWLDPEIKDTLERLPNDVAKHIKVIGFVDNKRLAHLYKNAFAFVSPSLYEGFGLPFLEAQNAGVPVIGSNRGALSEVIGNSGILVDPENREKLILAMKKMTSNTIHQEYIVKGKANARKYAWQSFAKKIQSAINSLQ